MIEARLSLALPGPPPVSLARTTLTWHLPRVGDRVDLGIEGVAPLRVESVTHRPDLQGPPRLELAAEEDPLDPAALLTAGFVEEGGQAEAERSAEAAGRARRSGGGVWSDAPAPSS